MAPKKKKRSFLSKAEFLAKMAAGRAAAALKRGGKPAKRKRPIKKNAGPKLKRLPKKTLDKYYRAAAKGKTRTMERIAKSAVRKGKKRTRKNPEAEAAERFEYFHGPGAEGRDTVTDVTEKLHEHSVLSGIGTLTMLRIASIDGARVVRLEKFAGAMLAQDEKGTQLFIKGGNQSVNLKDFGIYEPHENEVLGALMEVSYKTDKTHLRPEDGGKAVYNHVFGKNKSRLPLVVYDVRNKLLHLAGGGYTLPEVGISG